jgi:hypothetical protein
MVLLLGLMDARRPNGPDYFGVPTCVGQQTGPDFSYAVATASISALVGVADDRSRSRPELFRSAMGRGTPLEGDEALERRAAPISGTQTSRGRA